MENKEKINFPKKTKIKGEKNLEGGEEKIKLQKKLRSRLIKGKKKIKLGWHMDRKENLISAPSIVVGAMVGVGLLGPYNHDLYPKKVQKLYNCCPSHTRP